MQTHRSPHPAQSFSTRALRAKPPNTLSSRAFPVLYTPVNFPDPVIRMAIHSKSKGDEDRMANGLHSLHEEDPTFVIAVDGQLSQTVIAGQGELHLLIVTLPITYTVRFTIKPLA